MATVTEAFHFRYLSAENFTPPASSTTDATVATAADINDSKVRHRYCFALSQTGAVVAATQYLRILQAAGTLLSLEAAITEAVATGADRTATIDLQKSTGGGAFSTVLSATIVFNNVSVLRTVSTGTFSSSPVIAGDILKLTVAVAGAAGAQAAGLVVNLVIAEKAQ